MNDFWSVMTRQSPSPNLHRLVAAALGRPARLIPFPPSLIRLAGKLTGKSMSVDRLLGSLVVDSPRIGRNYAERLRLPWKWDWPGRLNGSNYNFEFWILDFELKGERQLKGNFGFWIKTVILGYWHGISVYRI